MRDALFLAAVIACALVPGGWFAHRHMSHHREGAEAEAVQTLGGIADLKLAQVSRWLAERGADAALMRDERRLVEEGLRALENAPDDEAEARLGTWLGTAFVYSSYSSALLVGPDFEVVATFSWMIEAGALEYPVPEPLTHLSERSEWLAGASVERREPVLTDPQRDPETGRCYHNVIVPLMAVQGGDGVPRPSPGPDTPGEFAAGFLVFQADLEHFMFALLSAEPFGSPSAETLLVKQAGGACIYMGPMRHDEDAPPMLTQCSMSDRSRAAVMALRGDGGAYRAIDYRGEPVFFVSRLVPATSTHWHLITKIDVEEVIGPVRAQARDVWLGVGLLTAILALGFGWIWRQREAHALRRLLASERERRNLQAQLVQSQKLESIGTLAGGVAHEINNPINGIMNYAELILDEMRGAEGSAEAYAGEIVREGERIAKLVRNLLRFSRRESATRLAVTPSELIESALPLVQTVLRRDDIRIQVDVPADLPEISCYLEQIQQVLVNLLTNARDALNERYPDGHRDKRIRIAAGAVGTGADRRLRITVEDFGPGIPEQARARIFDPFYTTKRAERGTGLGLSVCYGIVQDHGGTISVESEVGTHTRFHVDLPVAVTDEDE